MENKEIKRKEIKKKSYERIINTNFQNIEDEDNILENESKFSVEIILYEEEIGIIIREIGETKDDNLDLYEKYYSYDELKEMNDIFAVKKNLGKIYDSLLAKFDGKVDVVSMEGDNIIINLKYMIDDSEIEVSLEIPLIQKNEDEVKNLKDSIIELKKQKKYYKKEVDKLKEEIRMLKEKENNISNDLNNIRKEMDYMKNFMKENFSYFSNQEEKSIEKPDLDVQVPPKLIKSDNIEYKELSKECPCIKEPTKIDIQNVEQKVEEKKEEDIKIEIKEEKQEEPIPLYKTPVPIPVVSTIGQPQISQTMSIYSEENIINYSETTFLSIFKLDNKIKIKISEVPDGLQTNSVIYEGVFTLKDFKSISLNMETLEVLFKNIKFSIENEKYGLKKVDKDLIIINLQFLCGYTTEEMNLKIKRATLQFDKTLNNLEETITKINRDFKRVINSPDIVLWTINEKNPESFFDSKDKWNKYPKEIESDSKEKEGEKKLTGWYRDIPKI